MRRIQLESGRASGSWWRRSCLDATYTLHTLVCVWMNSMMVQALVYIQLRSCTWFMFGSKSLYSVQNQECPFNNNKSKSIEGSRRSSLVCNICCGGMSLGSHWRPLQLHSCKVPYLVCVLNVEEWRLWNLVVPEVGCGQPIIVTNISRSRREGGCF